MNPTKADREAFAREYWPDGVARGTSGDVWIETGRGGNPAWDAGARAVAGLRAELLDEAERVSGEAMVELQDDLLRLAAQVAVKVGEHEYARGTRDRERAIKSAISVGIERAFQFITLYGRHMREHMRRKGGDYTLLNLIESLDRGELRPPEDE